MSTSIQDLRYAFRMLAKTPMFTLVVVVTLALGIGANTAIFSVVDAVVLRPLPFPDPDQLVMVYGTDPESDSTMGTLSYPDFADIREQNGSFEDIAILRHVGSTITGTDTPERVDGARVSAGFFPLLRTQPAAGRLFRAEDDLPGAEKVVVLSHALWQRRFACKQSTLGQAITLDGTDFTVIGVLPADFTFPVNVSNAEIWTPAALDEDFLLIRGAHLARAVGRLNATTTLTQAQADVDTVAQRLAEQYPDSNTGRGIRLGALHEEVVGDVRPAALVLFGAVGFVLLIACANVANLSLARSAHREQELAVRAALGAGRTRLVRQLLTESVLLAVIGGAFGLLLAQWGTELLVAILPGRVPRAADIGVDERVLAFALLASLATGLVSGLVPALSASRCVTNLAMKEGGRTTVGGGRRRLRNLLVVSEVALALVLLVGAGLMIRSLHRLTQVDYGFDPGNLLTFQMSIPFSAYEDPVPRAVLYGDVVDRLGSLPGVTSVGATATLPAEGPSIVLTLQIAGRPDPPPGEEPEARANSVTSDYFRAMGIALRRGRFFTAQDRRDAPGVAIINEAMARRYWANEEPIGQNIIPSARLGDDDPESYEIVGIVADVRVAGPDRPERPCMYFPYEQQTWPFMSFALRTTVDPKNLIGAVRREVAGVTKDEAAYSFKTMDQIISESRSVGGRRYPTLLLGMFAALATILAAMGIYATLSYSVVQRTREIGVRMAVGARRIDVRNMVLSRGLVLTATGVGIGLLAALALTRVLTSQLYEIGAFDPATFGGVSVLLVAVALLACYMPARRATRVDPMTALRCE